MFIIMNLAIGGDLGGIIQITDWSDTGRRRPTG
jgi:hypothetical protein